MPLTIPKGYPVYMFANNQSPTDLGTIFYGINLPAAGTSFRVYMPYTGILRRAYLNVVVSPTVGSGESTTWAVRLNNTTDITCSSAVLHSSSPLNYSITTLSTGIVAGDYLETKMTYPTFVTNPVGVYYAATYWIEIP